MEAPGSRCVYQHREEELMERVAIVVHLKEGTQSRAAELLAKGPPFDLAETGIVRHSVYLSSHEIVFVFEGHEIEWVVDELIDEPFHHELQRALEQWRAIVDEPPRMAREQFGWEQDESESAPPERNVSSGSWP
jgi:hypothetical protein